MDSAGLGALIGGIRRAREAGGDVAVACSRPTLTRLLHTTGFDRIVPVTETVEAAATALATVDAAERRPSVANRYVADLGEAVEVVHVGAQERHPDHRRGRDPLGQAGEVLLLA